MICDKIKRFFNAENKFYRFFIFSYNARIGDGKKFPFRRLYALKGFDISR